MKTILTIIIMGAGFYFWKKPFSRIARTTVAGLTLSTCTIVWLFAFASNTPITFLGTDDPSLSPSQSQSRSQKTITTPSTGNTAPQPAPGRPTSQEAVAKEPQRDVKHDAAPISNAVATTDETIEPAPAVAKVKDDQLDALIGDAIPVKPEGSTMVDTIVKKGTIQKAERNSPSEDDYSFPQVIQGSGGMTMIIPDEPLPSVSSRRQLTAGDDEIPAPGEVVALSYDMFSWSTGEMVESSQTTLNGPLMYRLGGVDTPIGIPKYLDEAINNRPFGSTVQVIFEKEMHDLPGNMDRNDSYVLVVRVDRPEMDGESALEHMKNAITQ